MRGQSAERTETERMPKRGKTQVKRVPAHLSDHAVSMRCAVLTRVLRLLGGRQRRGDISAKRRCNRACAESGIRVRAALNLEVWRDNLSFYIAVWQGTQSKRFAERQRVCFAKECRCRRGGDALHAMLGTDSVRCCGPRLRCGARH